MAQQKNEELQLSQLQELFEKYKNLIIGVGVVIVLIVGFFLYRGYQKNAQQQKAAPLMEYPQQYFKADSFNLALYGDGLNPGFLEIIDKYGRSKAGNLANYYAGVSFLQLGEFQAAIDYLKDFETDVDMMQARTYESIGHAYAQLGDMDNAGDYYNMAYKAVDNEFFTPYLMQLTADFHLSQGNYTKALELYKAIKQQYPNSQEGQDVDKYIAHAAALAE